MFVTRRRKAAEGQEEASEASEEKPRGRRRWSRARRPEEKEARRAAILTAAVEILDGEGLAGASLSAIARRAGISKANTYRYFESREAILLAVALADIEDWTADLARRLEPLVGSGDVEAVARALAACTSARPRLCGLITVLSSVLEHNVSAEVIVEFKRGFNGLMGPPIEAIDGALPGLDAEQTRAFMTFFYVFVAGCWPIAHPPEVVREVHAKAEFEGMRIEFEPTVQAHAQTLLTGLLVKVR